jgi:hypothetical protein
MSYFASVYVKIITGMKIHDATAGFICYRREVLEKLTSTPSNSSATRSDRDEIPGVQQ